MGSSAREWFQAVTQGALVSFADDVTLAAISWDEVKFLVAGNKHWVFYGVGRFLVSAVGKAATTTGLWPALNLFSEKLTLSSRSCGHLQIACCWHFETIFNRNYHLILLRFFSSPTSDSRCDVADKPNVQMKRCDKFSKRL